MTPKTVTIDNGATVDVEAGALSVPESRTRPTDRRITIPYYRLRSTSAKPAAPIFLLAGGPGSSWLDQLENEENFKEVAFYRSIADVVLFDQRGGGHSQPNMTCPQSAQLPAEQPLDLGELGVTMRRLAVACRDHWLAQGIDLSAYNTVENANDVDELRKALGYGKISLVGGSYGSHLALQIMRLHPATIDRAILYGIEGPDHSWDDPAATLRTLRRIAAVAEGSRELGPHIPEEGLLAILQRVLQRLEAKPERISVGTGADARTVVVDANLIRFIAARGAGRRSKPNAWPETLLAMDRGDFRDVARLALSARTLSNQDPMHYMMDCASGISPERQRRYERDPARTLLGDINLEYGMLCDIWPSADLGAAFRVNLRSSIPTLLLHGSWDTSTPIENAREVAASLSNARLVEVEEGGHGALYNLYEHCPPMYDRMRRFLLGEPADFPARISMPPVTFEPIRPQPPQ